MSHGFMASLVMWSIVGDDGDAALMRVVKVVQGCVCGGVMVRGI